MTNTIAATTTSTELSLGQGFNELCELADKLVVLNEEQYRTIFAIYGKEGTNKYEELFSKNVESSVRASELYSFFDNDDNKERLDKLTTALKKNYEEYIKEENRLNSLKEAASKATREKNNFQKTIASREATFTKELEQLVNTDELK